MTKTLILCRCCGVIMDQPALPETSHSEDNMCITCVVKDEQLHERRWKLVDAVLCYALIVTVLFVFFAFA